MALSLAFSLVGSLGSVIKVKRVKTAFGLRTSLRPNLEEFGPVDGLVFSKGVCVWVARCCGPPACSFDALQMSPVLEK